MTRAKTSTPAAYLVEPDRAGTYDVMGPTIQFLTPLDDSAPAIMRGTIPAGVSVPLHSHADPETFVLLSGSVEGLVDADGEFYWMPLGQGNLFHVPGHARHAWRNTGQSVASMLIITTARLARFLQEVGRPVTPGARPASPSPDRIAHFLRTSARYGYWNASPEENARIGIFVPMA